MNVSDGQCAHILCGSIGVRGCYFQIYCGENEIQASLISSDSAGATPAPATFHLDEWINGLVDKWQQWVVPIHPSIHQSTNPFVHQSIRGFCWAPVAETAKATRCLREECGCKSRRE